METPFPAYRGDEPYIFVCYSHEDSAVVFPELQRLRDGGVNVYYDEGISPGQEWTQELADAIDGSSQFLYFVSPSSVASRYCRNEIQYALEQAKSLVSVFLEPTELPGGLKLSLGPVQAIMKYELSVDEYQRKLASTFGFYKTPPDSRADPPPALRPSRWRLGAVGLLAFVLIAAAGIWWGRQGGSVQQNPLAGTSAIPSARSVAVLPFVNMSEDKSNEYFSDGISEELLNVLARINGLRVPSRTSSFTFKGSDKRLADIGSALNVEHIIEGSVRKDGNKIRVTAQLVEVRSDTYLWSETYTRELDDIFAVQDEIAQSIVRALQQQLSSEDQQYLVRRSTSNVEAYNLFLLGRYLWNQRTTAGLLAAIDALREAVALDPDFDQAWSELANTYLAIPEYAAGPAETYIPLALEAANRALALNPNSANALANIGYYKAIHEYDWEGASAYLERALALEPNNAAFHQWYGGVLNVQDELDQALHHLQIARRLDPLSHNIRHIPGYILLWRFRLDEAAVHYKDAAELGENTRWSLHNMDFLNCFRGNWDEARRYATQLAETEGFDPAADLARIDAMENPALRDRALALLEQRQDIGDTVFGKPLQYAVLEDYERALDGLEKAYESGDSYITHINYMKVFDPIRDDPRFQALLRNMNLLQ